MRNLIDILNESIFDIDDRSITLKGGEGGFSDYFYKGDICLWLREFSQNRESKVSFSIAKIIKVSKTMVKYIETRQNSDGEWVESTHVETFKRKHKSDKYPHSANYSASATLLPMELSKEAAQMIVNDCTLTAGYYWAGKSNWKKDDRPEPVVVYDAKNSTYARSAYNQITKAEAKEILKDFL